MPQAEQQKNLEMYRELGFCVFRQCIEPDVVQQVLSDIRDIVRLQLAYLGQEGGQCLEDDLEILLRANPERYLAALRRSAKLYSVHSVFIRPEVSKKVASLGLSLQSICSEPVLHVNGDRLVIPNGYQGFAAHQDWPSIQGSLDCVVSWVPLVPIHAQKFPLMVSPRSHLRGMIQGRIQANALEISSEDIAEDSFIPVVVDVGDVVCMSSWTVHKTGVVGSQGMRISCSTRWDNAAEATFVERKYPCAYQRTVQRNLITADFPSVEQVQSVFRPPLA